MQLPWLFYLPLAGIAVATRPPCPLDGAELPWPSTLPTSSAFQHASSRLQHLLDSANQGNLSAGWAVANTSFSIAVVSQRNSATPVWEYHHGAKVKRKGVREPTGDSQYLIGSISKMMTDFALLRSGVDPSTPVTKYLPELAGGDSQIAWADVTLESLGNHLAGIPADYGFPEIYQLVPLFEDLGFPHLNKSDFLPCGIIGLNGPCSPQQLYEGMKESYPVAPPQKRPNYSNVAYSLLALALQKATGKNFKTLIKDFITTPFDLANTGVSPGKTSNAVIPLGDSSWGAHYGINAPQGGLYSSVNDLSKVAFHILNGSALDKESDVRKWLKPQSSSGSINSEVGLPWEIYRTTNLTPDHPHPIDIYAKDGGAQGYVARLAIVEQYGIAVSILTAGDTEAMYRIAEAVFSILLPAIDSTARLEAERYVGHYISEPPTYNGKASTYMNVSMDDGPGLKLDALHYNGSDIFKGINAMWSSMLVSLGVLSQDFRMYPSDITREVQRKRPDGSYQTVIEEDWRLAFDLEYLPGYQRKSDLPSMGVFSKWCTTWQTLDLLQYGGQPIDRFVFRFHKRTGRLMSVHIPFLMTDMEYVN